MNSPFFPRIQRSPGFAPWSRASSTCARAMASSAVLHSKPGMLGAWDGLGPGDKTWNEIHIEKYFLGILLGKKNIHIYIYIQDPYRNPMKFNLTAVLGDLIERFQAKFQIESHFGNFWDIFGRGSTQKNWDLLRSNGGWSSGTWGLNLPNFRSSWQEKK